MPNDTDTKKEAEDAAAKAAADKKAADDKAVADKKAADDAAAAGGETVTIKKSDYEKTLKDLDNYRTGLIGKKAGERDLHGGNGGGDGGGQGGGQGGNGTGIDEKRAGEIAAAASTKTLRDANEKSAKRIFFKKHPEYLDDTAWQTLAANLTFKGGEVTSEDIYDRLEAALYETLRQTGKLDEHLEKERERARQDGRVEGGIRDMASGGNAGDRNEGGSRQGTLSPAGESMARAMHTDPEAVKKVDITKDNVINKP